MDGNLSVKVVMVPVEQFVAALQLDPNDFSGILVGKMALSWMA
jgi:hypothetical protein